MADATIPTPVITSKVRLRYLEWIGRLVHVQEIAAEVENAPDLIRKANARARLQAVARSLDAMSVPHGWKSWEHLGDAIMADRRVPAVG